MQINEIKILENKKMKIYILLCIDLFLIFTSYLLAFIFRFSLEHENLSEIFYMYKNYGVNICVSTSIFIMSFIAFKQYRSIWSLAGINEFIRGVSAVLLATLINVSMSLVINSGMSIFITLLSGLMILVFCNGVRIGWRVFRRIVIYSSIKNSDAPKRILIVGAGSGGALVLSEYKKNPQMGKSVVAFVDDNKQKIGTFIGGVKVLGTTRDITRISKEKSIDEIVIAIANLENKELKTIIEKCKESKAKVKIMPGVSEMIDCKFSINSIRDIDVEDLLGREAITLDYDGISDYLKDKVVLVTGGGGSIGSELCRQIAKFDPNKLIIFDIYENNAYDIQNELKRNYPNLNLDTLIGSVRDRKRLREIYSKYHPNVVFHAAAHKHVPLMEDSPQEAIKNNVVGTFNVAEMSNNFGVEKFVLISTDKAVNPTNIMGATKRICEMIIQAFNKESNTEFVAVRFGNVLGSNGSVVPLFKKQIACGGPVTLTHKDITRYFMTIPEASQLVLQAGAYADGGEIFVLDMGKPVRIYDLAKNLIKLSGFEPYRDINIEITGLRPGEKLYEELLMNEEGLGKTKHKKIFIGKPGEHNLDYIVNKIKELVNVSELNDKNLLKNKMKEIVTTYKEPIEINREVEVDEDIAISMV